MISFYIATFINTMNEFVEKSLKELYLRYKNELQTAGDSNIELEIRFKDIKKEAFESIYTYCLNSPEFTNPTLETSINFVSDNIYEKHGKSDESSYVRTIMFDHKAVKSDSYVKKTKLMRPIYVKDYVTYAVTISKETPVAKFPTNPKAEVRFKIRTGFIYEGWRFDLTLVKRGDMSSIGSSLTQIRDNLFSRNLTVQNLLTEVDFGLIDNYEVEIERVDGPISDVSIAKKIFAMINQSYLSESIYQDEIYSVAEKFVSPARLPAFKHLKLKQLLNQAIALNKNTYYDGVYPADGFLATIKADGERVCVVIRGTCCRILGNTVMEIGTNCSADIEVIADCELLTDELRAGTINTADDDSSSSEDVGKDVDITEPAIEPGVGTDDVIGENTNDESTNTTNDTVTDEVTGGFSKDMKEFRIRVFDVITVGAKGVHNQGIEQRTKYLDAAVDSINKCFKTPVAFAAEYVVLDSKSLEAGYRSVYDKKYDHPTDGVMISEPGLNYTDTKNYKWKPYEFQTIDFLAVKCPQKLLGIKPFEIIPDQNLYLLFVGINRNMREQLGIEFLPHYKNMFDQYGGEYFPIQFSPSSNPLAYIYYHTGDSIDKKIVELGRDDKNTKWVFHRVRNDREMSRNYYGNDFRIAELTYTNYINPMTFSDLWNPSDGYFDHMSGDTHFASNKYKRFLISSLLKNNLSNVRWIIDEAAGRGADMNRYQEIGVEHALFIDIDSAAIAELISRKFSFFSRKNNGKKPGTNKIVVTAFDKTHHKEYDKVVTRDQKHLTVHTLVADLRTPCADLMAQTYQFGLNPGICNGIICNFALHYMCGKLDDLRNVLTFNSKMLRSGGLFIATVMDGEAIFNMLRDFEFGQTWEIKENRVVKYAIRKEYRGDKLAAVGQNIAVLLPFSDEMKTEPLCNLSTVITEATKLGFELELNESMSTYMSKFASASPKLFSELTPDDKLYIGLYRYITFRKMRDGKK